MSKFSWKAQSFLQKSTSRPLAAVVVTLFFALIITIVIANYTEVDQIVFADGEVVPTAGEVDIVAQVEGTLINWNVEVGSEVHEGQILGQIQIPDTKMSDFKKVMTDLKSLNNQLSAIPFQRSKLSKISLDDYEINNPIIMKCILNSELALNRLESISDHKHIEPEKIETLNILKNSYLTIRNLYEATLIRSYGAGIIAKKLAQSSQRVIQNQKLLAIISDQIHFQLQLSIPANKVSQVKPSNKVKVAVDSYPYQRFGHFSGEIESIDRMPTSNQNDIYLASSSIQLPKMSRRPSSEIQLLPGMKAKVYIQTGKISILEMIYEKVFSL